MPIGASNADGAQTDKKWRYRDRWGLLSAIRHAFVQHLASVFGIRIYGIYNRPVETHTGPDPVVPGFTFRLYSAGEEAELFAAAVRPELGITGSFVKSAFGKGDICSATLYNGQIVSFQWSAYTPTHDHDGVYIEFGGECQYNYFSYSLPEFRGRHLPRIFKPLRDRVSIARGCTHCIAYISIDNDASIRSAIANGNRRVGFAGYISRRSMFLAFRTPGARKCPMRFFKSTSTTTTQN
jgi:hypothetical protein